MSCRAYGCRLTRAFYVYTRIGADQAAVGAYSYRLRDYFFLMGYF
ncbi:hypothetical protein UNSWDHB_2746 [Dehalobacter sp. UNSWDHB]|nr:hypothetical protein UNSWDHB_2746 [Dehalobacter sp. UNSWDHB]